jgi:hypothetical protein
LSRKKSYFVGRAKVGEWKKKKKEKKKEGGIM